MSDLIERTDRLRSIVAEARELGSHGSEMQEDILAVCDEIERLQAKVEALEDVRLMANRYLFDPDWDTHRNNLIDALKVAATEQERE